MLKFFPNISANPNICLFVEKYFPFDCTLITLSPPHLYQKDRFNCRPAATSLLSVKTKYNPLKNLKLLAPQLCSYKYDCIFVSILNKYICQLKQNPTFCATSNYYYQPPA